MFPNLSELKLFRALTWFYEPVDIAASSDE